jgi:hypothetical protein
VEFTFVMFIVVALAVTGAWIVSLLSDRPKNGGDH